MGSSEMTGSVVIVGAGLAGLSCAVHLAGKGRKVRVLEAANHAGGRCRSYDDDRLGTSIDNGNHILLSGNAAAFDYLRRIGAEKTMSGPDFAAFPFFDLRSGRNWTVHPNRGQIPWWIFSPSRRVPGTRPSDYLKGIRLAFAGPERTVAQALRGTGALYEAFWEPFALAVMNTAPEEASAALLWPVLRETFGRGEQAFRPRISRGGLSDSFVDPALAYLRRKAVSVEFGRRVRDIVFDGEEVRELDLGDERLAIAADDRIVLAVPPANCRKLLPGIVVPDEFRTILNAHFAFDGGPSEPEFIGLLGGISQWIFHRRKVISVTVSAADPLLDSDPAELAEKVWGEVSKALRISASGLPPWRLVREKRATIAQTPAQVRLRPATRTRFSQVVLAGDWTDTGIPATIEGAVRSGRAAAETIADSSVCA